jgi:hypothetical protein
LFWAWLYWLLWLLSSTRIKEMNYCCCYYYYYNHHHHCHHHVIQTQLMAVWSTTCPFILSPLQHESPWPALSQVRLQVASYGSTIIASEGKEVSNVATECLSLLLRIRGGPDLKSLPQDRPS